jgi:hypothetical protein
MPVSSTQDFSNALCAPAPWGPPPGGLLRTLSCGTRPSPPPPHVLLGKAVPLPAPGAHAGGPGGPGSPVPGASGAAPSCGSGSQPGTHGRHGPHSGHLHPQQQHPQQQLPQQQHPQQQHPQQQHPQQQHPQHQHPQGGGHGEGRPTADGGLASPQPLEGPAACSAPGGPHGHTAVHGGAGAAWAAAGPSGGGAGGVPGLASPQGAALFQATGPWMLGGQGGGRASTGSGGGGGGGSGGGGGGQELSHALPNGLRLPPLPEAGAMGGGTGRESDAAGTVSNSAAGEDVAAGSADARGGGLFMDSPMAAGGDANLSFASGLGGGVGSGTGGSCPPRPAHWQHGRPSPPAPGLGRGAGGRGAINLVTGRAASGLSGLPGPRGPPDGYADDAGPSSSPAVMEALRALGRHSGGAPPHGSPAGAPGAHTVGVALQAGTSSGGGVGGEAGQYEPAAGQAHPPHAGWQSSVQPGSAQHHQPSAGHHQPPHLLQQQQQCQPPQYAQQYTPGYAPPLRQLPAQPAPSGRSRHPDGPDPSGLSADFSFGNTFNTPLVQFQVGWGWGWEWRRGCRGGWKGTGGVGRGRGWSGGGWVVGRPSGPPRVTSGRDAILSGRPLAPGPPGNTASSARPHLYMCPSRRPCAR